MLKKSYNNLFKSKLSKNIALIAGGTAFAQVIGIVFFPIITRIYLPEEYGILTVFSATLGIIVVISSLDYYKAIPIADDDKKAINVLALSLFILVLFVIFTTILLFLWGTQLLTILNSTALIKYKYFIPIGVLFAGGYNILLQWALRMQNYKQVTKTKINQSLTSNILMVILGLLKLGPIGLIFGKIIGQSAGLTSLLKPVLETKELVRQISIKDARQMVKRYIKFPLYLAPSNYIKTVADFIPIIFLTAMFGTGVTGLFGLANNIVKIPMNLIGTSVAQVFYAEAAKSKTDPEKLKILSLQLIKKLALIGLLPLIVLIAFGPLLFSIVFGSSWYQAGVYAQIMGVMVYFLFITSPIGRIPEIFERQKEILLFHVVRILIILFAFGLSKYMSFDPFQTIAIYAVFNSLTFFLFLIITQKILNHEIKIKYQ